MKKKRFFFILNYLLLGVGGCILVAPLFTGQYFLHLIITISIWVLLTVGLNFVVAMGYNSICQAAFYGIGAYTAALLTLKAGTPFWFNLIGGMFLAGCSGLLIGYPAFKMRGHYFAIVTLAFGLILNLIFFNWNTITGGDRGLTGIFPPFFSIVYYYYVVVGSSFIVIFISHKLFKSRFGRQLLAIREDEDLALQIGINTKKCKLLSFSIGACFAGLAGGLMVHYTNFIHPEFFTFGYSFTMLMGVLIGGSGTTVGAILGAGIAVGLPEIFRFAEGLRYIILGVILIVIVSFLPRGIVGTVVHYFYQKKSEG